MKLAFGLSLVYGVVATLLLYGSAGAIYVGALLLPGYLLYRFLKRRKNGKSN